MKRYVAFFLSILMLATMTACGGQPTVNSSPRGEESSPVCTPDQQIPEQGDKKPVVTKDSEQTSEQATNSDLAYSELVERFRALVSDPFGQDVFYLTKDGTELECESFLFTGLNSDGDLEVYYNETGSWDPAESEKSDMTAEDFWALDPAGEPLALTPFSGSGGWNAVESESPVSVQYLMEVGDEDYDWVTLYDGSDACCILITSDSWVSNLNIWNLFVEDVADDGTVTCSTTLAGDDCHWDTVTLDTPIAVQLIFYGDLPTYGISYEDQHGTLHCFAIEVSGDDGSLLLREADQNENEFVLRAEW